MSQKTTQNFVMYSVAPLSTVERCLYNPHNNRVVGLMRLQNKEMAGLVSICLGQKKMCL